MSSHKRQAFTDSGFRHIESVHCYSLDVRDREIYISGESESTTEHGVEPGVEFLMAEKLIKNIRVLANYNPKESILIHMKTCGGDWTEGMAIYDAIRLCPCPITILSYTHARSMSSIILQAADYRVLMPSSYFMYHWGTYSDGGHLPAVKNRLAWATKYDDPLMIHAYADRMRKTGKFKGKTLATVQEYLEEQMNKHEDVFLTPIEAIKLGLADAIFDGNWKALKSIRKKFEW